MLPCVCVCVCVFLLNNVLVIYKIIKIVKFSTEFRFLFIEIFYSTNDQLIRTHFNSENMQKSVGILGSRSMYVQYFHVR